VNPQVGIAYTTRIHLCPKKNQFARSIMPPMNLSSRSVQQNADVAARRRIGENDHGIPIRASNILISHDALRYAAGLF
jgi:hypothetical protein